MIIFEDKAESNFASICYFPAGKFSHVWRYGSPGKYCFHSACVRLRVRRAQACSIKSLAERSCHTQAVLSALPVATHLLSGLKATAYTVPSCGRRATSRPLTASHNRAILSVLPVANHLPSGLKATAHTAPSCARRATSRPLATSHTRAVLSALPVATHLPSGLK